MDTERTTAVDLSVYDLDVVHRAAYAFTGQAHIQVNRSGENAATVVFRAVGKDTLPPDIVRRFENELVDYRVRQTLHQQTAVIRDLIFRQAFVEADLE